MHEAVLAHNVDCNICGANRVRDITIQNSFKFVRCKLCGFVYVTSKPASDLYKELYADYLQDKMEEPSAWRLYMRKVFGYTAGVIESMVPEQGSALDIGCGFGFFVEELKKRGWKASGIDLSPAAVSYARNHGLDVVQGTIETAGFSRDSFDVITMFYVLEHVPDPLDTLKSVYRLLKPGGLLFLRLPHTTPLVRALDFFSIKNNLYDPPFHLSDFSPRTTRMILEKADYREVRTFIGGMTLPRNLLPRIVSMTSTSLAELFYILTKGRFLLPGVSKTTVARKPLSV